MNAQQLAVYEHVLQCINGGAGSLFFLNRPGGTRKTFVYQAISHAIHGQGIVLCVASSGIASILLPEGRGSWKFGRSRPTRRRSGQMRKRP